MKSVIKHTGFCNSITFTGTATGSEMILWRFFFLTIHKHNSNETQINTVYDTDNIKKESEEFKMAKSKLVAANQKIADGVVGGYKKIEEGVVGGYKKVEGAVVGGYKKIEDAFVDRYLTHEGETVEDAKKRLYGEQEKRQAEGKQRYDHQMEQTMEHVKKAHEKAFGVNETR